MIPRPPRSPASLGSKQSAQLNGNGAHANGASTDRVAATTVGVSPSKPSFLAPFLGAFAAVLVIAVVGGIGYFAIKELNSPSTSGTQSKNLLLNVSKWQPGQDAATKLDGNGQTDIGWWARTFDLPNQEAVTDYLQKQGLTVSRIEPAHYESTPDATTITYNIYAEVPNRLMHLQKTAWLPLNVDMSRFTHVLVLNDDLPPGTMWNTQNPTVAAEAGTKLDFAWKVHWDKTYQLVDTDRLPLSEGVFTSDQVSQYQAETNNTLSQLQNQISQINTQVQSDTQAKLAQVPADPPKPELASSKFGGDGSGEPTKSAERIGGGTVAGAAGGAAFGAAAGDAGMGAGIGAGVGLLGGFIYDMVSKNNDKKKYQRKVAAENEERLDGWRSQVKALKQQRNQIQQDGLAERDRELTDLANRIAANKGRLDGIASAAAEPVSPAAAPTSTPAPQTAPSAQPPVDQPSADTPSGPIQQP